jgi:putative transport protein
VAAQSAIGVEVDDKELLDFPVETTDVIVTERAYTRVPLGEFLRRAELDTLRGVGVKRVTRGGAELPLTLGLKLARGDVVTLVGTPEAVAKTAARIGYIDRPSSTTDMAIVATVIFVGGLIGLPALEIGRLELGLSQSVGVLLSGLVLGWLRSVDRRVPRLPEATVWLFDSLGLTVFLAVTALAAGPDFVTGLRQSGLSLLAGAIVLVVVPQFVTMLVGRFAFRMHPGILLGVCSGASTSAPSLAAVQEVARSKVPTLGYGVTYAVGNVLLALWGSVIVALMTV